MGFIYLPLQRRKAERGGWKQEVAFQHTDFQQVEGVNRFIEEPTKGESLRYSILKLCIVTSSVDFLPVS